MQILNKNELMKRFAALKANITLNNPFDSDNVTVIIPAVIFLMAIVICTTFAVSAVLAALGVPPIFALFLSVAGLCGLRVAFYMLKGK